VELTATWSVVVPQHQINSGGVGAYRL